jgi:SOS response regulatory protein OraA/RecX
MEPDRLLPRALALLAARPLSRHELKVKLAELAEPDLIEDVLAKLTDWGYLDDQRLAEGFVASHPGYGPAKLQQGLARRGISPEISQAALADFDPLAAGVRLLESHSWSHQGHEDKALRYLLRKGFSLSQAKLCYQSWINRQNCDSC